MNKALTLKINGVRPVKISFVKDLPDGNLFIAEAKRHIPFDIKRVYFINGLANPQAIRGKHAHHKLEQVLFCISGSFLLHLDDGKAKQRMKLNDPSTGIWLGPLVWHTMSSFSYDCIILVLANDHYHEADYIRDYDEFLRIARTQHSATAQ
jgi:dTDP-4-dehydrorhamnose 3,5-epimerase-like enzyme